MFKKYTIKEQECGYLMKNGKFVKLITAGRYTYAKFLGYEVLKVPMSGEVNTCGIPEDVLMKDADFASRVVKAVLPDTSLSIRFVNNAFNEVLTKPETLF